MTPFTDCPVEIYQDPEEFEQFLKTITAHFKNRPINVLEIGSMFGGTLWYWLQYLNVKNLYVIDKCVAPNDVRFEPQRICHYEKWPRWAHKKNCDIMTIFADSNAPATQNSIKTLAPKIDFLFIDGDHTQEAVAADFMNYKSFVHPGGLIAFHDICFPPSSVHYGVKPVWEKVRQDYKHLEIVKDPSQNGIGCLYV